MYKLKSIAKSKKNNRKENEDAIYNNDKHGVYIIADGMEGHNGKKASNFCIEFLSEDIQRNLRGLEPRDIEDIVIKCNKMLYGAYLGDIKGSTYGTTLDAVWFNKDRFHVFHVGDSRVYGLRNDKTLEQLTEDDRKGAKLVRENMLSKYDFSVNKFNKGYPAYQAEFEKVTRAMGVKELGLIYVKSFPVKDYDSVIMITDGVGDFVLDEEIQDILVERKSIRKSANKILNRIHEPEGIVDLNMKYNHYKLMKLFKKFKEEGINTRSFEILTDTLDTIKGNYEKSETIQFFCKKYSDLNELFKNTIKAEIGPRDNASIIIINIVDGLW